MRKQRHNAPGGGQNLGRVGAIGVLAAGALCAAVLSVASRVPPTPINAERIPAVEMGSANEGDVTPAVREDRQKGQRRHAAKRASHARHRGDGKRDRRARKRGDGVSASGSAVPVALSDSGGGAAKPAVGGPPSGGGSDGPASGTGPRSGAGGDRPGAGSNPGAGGNSGGGGNPGGGGNRGDRQQPGGAGGGAQPHTVPVTAPAPAPAQPGGGEAGDYADDDVAVRTGTAAREDAGEDEVEMETDPAPAAAIQAPTLAHSDDSNDE
jgi:hypothetical protein